MRIGMLDSSMIKFVIWVLVVIVCQLEVWAIKCYSCSACSDAFVSTENVEEDRCGVCLINYDSAGTRTVDRRCLIPSSAELMVNLGLDLSDSCHNVTALGSAGPWHKQCYCHANLCNTDLSGGTARVELSAVCVMFVGVLALLGVLPASQ